MNPLKEISSVGFEKTRPDWWPKCPWPENTFPDGSPPEMMRQGWEQASRQIFERMERALYDHATQLQEKTDE